MFRTQRSNDYVWGEIPHYTCSLRVTSASSDAQGPEMESNRGSGESNKSSRGEGGKLCELVSLFLSSILTRRLTQPRPCPSKSHEQSHGLANDAWLAD